MWDDAWDELVRSPLAAAWAGISVRVLVLLLAAAAACLASRRASAATRHRVWFLALAGSLALPFASLVVPGWPWTLPLPTVAVAPVASTLDGARPSTADIAPPGPVDVGRRVGVPRGASPEAGPVAVRGGGGRPTPPRVVEARRARPGSWMTWAIAAWAAGALLALLPMLAGEVALAILARRTGRVDDPEWQALARRLGRAHGLRRPVRLRRSDLAAMPMTWGWARPVVLLPAEADDWPQGRREVVLLHELAHVRRHDGLTQRVAGLACALHWPNPLAWLAAHRMRVERERACDDLVLLAGTRPSEYAQHLLSLARALRSPRATRLSSLAMARPSNLEGRLRAILDARPIRRGISRRAAALGWVVALGLVASLAAVRLRAEPGQGQGEGMPAPKPAEAAKAPAGATDPGNRRMTVAGRVVDPEGKPIAGARVAVVARLKRQTAEIGEDRDKPYGVGRADGDGRFRIDIPRTSSARERVLEVDARAPGWGLGGREVDPDVPHPEATITLDPERPIRGRLLDLQGQPVAGASLRVGWLSVPDLFFWMRTDADGHEGGDTPNWPTPVTTDGEGRFLLDGLGTRATLWLVAEGGRIANQEFKIEAGDDGRAGELALTAAPAQAVEARVVRADDGRPMAGAWVDVIAQHHGDRLPPWEGRSVRGRTDELGRVRLVPWPGDYFVVEAGPPGDQPYLTGDAWLEWPKGAVRQSLELKLPRGVALRGTLVEEASGEPVSGARVSYLQTRDNNPLYNDHGGEAVSGPDGAFTMVVPHGPGHLLVRAATPDYLHVVTNHAELETGKIPLLPMYTDALADLDIKPDATTHEVALRLRRGVTVAGKVVGPDGAPVAEGIVIGRTYTPYSYESQFAFSPFNGGAPQLKVRDGRVEVPGCDPEKPYTFHVFDREHLLGATVELSGRSAVDGPVTIRLRECGAATVRYAHDDGTPVAGHKPELLELVLTPGAEFGTMGRINADIVFQVQLDRDERNRGQETDADGRITFVALIPGARYRFLDQEFTAEAGRTIGLRDVTIPRPDREEP